MQQNNSVCSFSGGDSWVILSPIEQSIKRKIEAVGTPLKDWDINIYRGVLTGCNEAFIISGAKKNEILANCQTEDERMRTAELIRPILRGRDIKRYKAEFADLWLIWIPWHFPLHQDKTIKGVSLKAEELFKIEYPSVYNYLLSYKPKLENRNKAETGIRYEWYALQRWGAEYWEDFSKPKIFYADISECLNFCLCTETYMCNNTVYFMSTSEQSNLEYILTYLNSNIIDWYYKTLSVQLGERAVRLFSIYVMNIPIPKNGTTDIYKAFGLEDHEIKYIEAIYCN